MTTADGASGLNAKLEREKRSPLATLARLLKWAAFNAAFGAVLWFGFVEGLAGAQNIGLFLAWVNVILSFVMFTEPIQEKLAAKGRTVPAWLNGTFDFSVALFFCWFGAWVTAVAWFIHWMVQEAAWLKALEKRSNAPAHGAAKPVPCGGLLDDVADTKEV